MVTRQSGYMGVVINEVLIGWCRNIKRMLRGAWYGELVARKVPVLTPL